MSNFRTPCNHNEGTVTTVTSVMKNCGTHEDKFVPLDFTKYEIYNVETTEVPNVIMLDDDTLLSSICSMICSQRVNTPSCIGFLSDVSKDHSCTLYTEVSVDSNIKIGPVKNVTETVYLRYGNNTRTNTADITTLSFQDWMCQRSLGDMEEQYLNIFLLMTNLANKFRKLHTPIL